MKIFYTLLVIALSVLTVKSLLWRVRKQHQAETKRIREEKEKEAREARIGFFTMIAHEIRTPVSLIIGPLENILKNTGVIPKPMGEDLHIINRNANRLLYLVNQLLDYRKVEQKSLVFHFASCHVSQLITAVSERFRPTFVQRHIAFSTSCSSDLTAVLDSEAFTKVVSNLLSNAVKYARSKVELSCVVDAAGDTFHVTVRDDGQGIREEDHERIFRPFFQSVDNRPGTGIGLSIVKNIVDCHKGRIDVDSTPGEGAAFVVTLPLNLPETAGLHKEVSCKDENVSCKDEAVTSGAVGGDSDGASSGMTILVVEDNEDLLHFIAKILRTEYRVLTAKDGVEALAMLEKAPSVSLVLSDWMMPNMDGEELCRRLRNNPVTSHLPFILLTAKTDMGSKITGLQCGADSFIEKPFAVAYLKERIRNLIHLRSVLKHKFSTSPLEPVHSIATSKVDDEFLRRMQQLIEENFSNSDLSVQFLADHLSVSRSGLFAKIKSLADMTPNDMILLVRLKKAAQLLREHKYHVNEICYMVGFSNPSYFSKCFKRQFGITPVDFASGT